MPQNVPQNGIYLTYVPHVPNLGHKWGTQCSRPQDALKGSKSDVKHVKIVEIYRILTGTTAPQHHMAPAHVVMAPFMLY